MKNKTLTLIATISLILAAALAPTSAQAATGSGNSDFILGISAMKLDTATSGTTFGNNDGAVTILNIKAGTMISGGIYIGGIYDNRSNVSNGSKDERTGYGATVGYHNDGWFIDGSYYVSSMYKLSGGSEVKNGSGFGVDVGNNVNVTANVYLGLQISYKSLSYTKVNAVDETNQLKSELTPMVNIGIMF